ncbi:hypothetical protein H4582DRAFT_463904 [Lactarius indigo]|nr:hypothetical protein H4582DRAFT_463904 [Lactarius indigo]
MASKFLIIAETIAPTQPNPKSSSSYFQGKSWPRAGSWRLPSGAGTSYSLIHTLTACVASITSIPTQALSDPSTRKSPSHTSTLRSSTGDASSGPREGKTPSLTNSSTSTLETRGEPGPTISVRSEVVSLTRFLRSAQPAPVLAMRSTHDSESKNASSAEARPALCAQGFPVHASSSKFTRAFRRASSMSVLSGGWIVLLKELGSSALSGARIDQHVPASSRGVGNVAVSHCLRGGQCVRETHLGESYSAVTHRAKSCQRDPSTYDAAARQERERREGGVGAKCRVTV